jgi:RNA polymerase sigma-70 factor (ECF subfamily)
MTILPDKFQEIVGHYAAPLTLYARQFFETDDFHAGEEVVQDVLYRLTQQKTEPPNLPAWLYKAVKNGAIAAARSQKRRKQRESKHAPVPYFEDDRSNELDVEETELYLKKLSTEQREIVTLHIWGGFSFANIGSSLGISAATAFRRYSEAIETLREEVEGRKLGSGE